MTRKWLTFLFCALVYQTIAQNKSLGVGTTTPNSNAALHVESPTNNQGFIMPRLTTAQRTSITPLTTTDKGLMVYDTDVEAIMIWDGTAWVTSTQGASGPKLAYPYKDSITTSVVSNWNLFNIVYNGAATENVGIARFVNFNPNNGFNPLFVQNYGTNGAGYFQVLNVNSLSPSLRGVTNSNQAAAHGILGRTTGTGGSAGYFEIANTLNTQASLKAITNGGGSAAYFENTSNTSGANGITSRINTNSSGTAIDGISNGQAGHGGSFYTANASNTFPTVNAISQGSGSAGLFTIFNASNNAEALKATTNGSGIGLLSENTGTGNAGFFNSAQGTGLTAVSAGNGSNALEAYKANGGGNSIQAGHNGSNAFGNGNAIYGFADGGTSNAIKGTVLVGNGSAGYFNVTSGGSGPAVYGISNGPNATFYGEITNAASSAYAANFRNTNVSSPGGAIYLVTYGTGSTANINHRGSSGEIIEFQNQDARVARIDKTGKGFFNGGTQTGGADVAEMFDVEGSRNEYEPGDVLVISESTDRTVEKSYAPNSTKVAGVYATKPGVILTEKNIDERIDELVPMGVVGVIPTKVCLENGPIRRGDLLVTSSKKGHAMKAVPAVINGVEIYPTGAILGKALQNFEADEHGIINVLVNVK